MSEIYQKCDLFAAFAGASAKYLGEREEVLAKKSRDEWQKERFTMHASLCGGGDLLKALESVASYLADRLLHMSNDINGKKLRRKRMPSRNLCKGVQETGRYESKLCIL